MPDRNQRNPPTNRQKYDGCLSGSEDCPFIPLLRSDPRPQHLLPLSLEDFRAGEGRDERKRRLHALYKQICERGFNTRSEARSKMSASSSGSSLSPEEAANLRVAYERELFSRAGGHSADSPHDEIGWKEFRQYAEAKEVELWSIFHNELDLDGNGHLDARELDLALQNAGIELSPATLNEFMTFLTSSPHSHAISFGEFRDFLLLLPRKVSTAEIYQYYRLKRFLGDDGRGVARLTMEGDVSLSAEDKPPKLPGSIEALRLPPAECDTQYSGKELEEEDEEEHGWLEGHMALKFLLAGGVAGAVSRTCTAPFDRLKIFLITRPPDLGGTPISNVPSIKGVRVIGSAIARIYAEGGLLAFWTGNGLSVAKIFPESAIKFFAYESTKRAFAKYWDHVDDPRDISGVSRFLAGGIGGISSQLSIYPVETLKTQMMSTTGHRRSLISAAKYVWGLGGMRAYYRGLTIGLVGVFPYSAIDMSTFEALKLAYSRSMTLNPNQTEPGVLALLAFGSISGSVGATSVYPLNLVRTRLQASGSSGHPQRYTGVVDVAMKTWEREGWRGFYRGLFPTLAKVIPSVSISYVVYEYSKRRLGV